MDIRTLAALLPVLLATLTSASAQAFPPVNDDCATPLVLPGPGIYPYDNQAATTGPQGQSESLCHLISFTSVKRDLWYVYTSPTTGTLSVSTCGLLVELLGQDSKIAIYASTGCPLAGSAIACNDDNCGIHPYNSTVAIPVLCGKTYTIQIGMYGGSPNEFTIQGSFSLVNTPAVACAGAMAPFCEGITMCPCQNHAPAGTARGCMHSNGAAASLAGSGVASVSADSVVLACTSLPVPPTVPSFLMYVQGNDIAMAPLGDGRVCVGGSVVRLAVKPFSDSTSSYPVLGDANLSVRGLVPSQCGVRYYQVWFRDQPLPCGSRSNLTNGWTVVWNGARRIAVRKLSDEQPVLRVRVRET